jgi:hypothetical protein
VIIAYESALFKIQSSSFDITSFPTLTECSVAASEVKNVISRVGIDKRREVKKVSIYCEQLAK